MLDREFQAKLEAEKLAALKELAYGASHEINNPLANIATRAQVLLRDETNDERRKMLATIASQAFRAHEMISDLMLFAKPPQPRLADVDLRDVVARVARESQADAESQGTALRLSLGELVALARADVDQIAVALRAIVVNAIQALKRGGEVSIEIGRAVATVGGEHSTAPWRITIRDTGPGIPPEVRRHLFDPFFSGREAGRGLGFGLAKAWRIITTLHGGDIVVESQLGSGATFIVTLPAL